MELCFLFCFLLFVLFFVVFYFFFFFDCHELCSLRLVNHPWWQCPMQVQIRFPMLACLPVRFRLYRIIIIRTVSGLYCLFFIFHSSQRISVFLIHLRLLLISSVVDYKPWKLGSKNSQGQSEDSVGKQQRQQRGWSEATRVTKTGRAHTQTSGTRLAKVTENIRQLEKKFSIMVGVYRD